MGRVQTEAELDHAVTVLTAAVLGAVGAVVVVWGVRRVLGQVLR